MFKKYVVRLSDEEMQTKVGEYWTVAIALAHLAWWDRRVMYVLDMTEKDGKLFVPEIDIFVNDLSLPLWAAIPPRAAARVQSRYRPQDVRKSRDQPLSVICPAATCSILDEWLDVVAPAEHESVSNMDQRRQIDVGLMIGNQLDEAPIDLAILRLLLVNKGAAVMDEAAPAG